MIPSASVVRQAVRLLGVVPVAPVRWLARRAAPLVYLLAGARRTAVLENQAALSPNATPAEQRRRARRTFANFLEAAVDLWRLPTLRLDDFDALVGIEGREHLDEAMSMERGVIAVTAHLGPYELGGAWLAHRGYPVHAMVEALDPETNAALALYREATGMKLLSRNAGVRASLRLLRERQVLLLVADRVVGDGADGLDVPFGAGRRAVPTGPAALSLATGAPIVVGFITRSPDHTTRYRVRLEAPMLPRDTGDAHRDRQALTREVAARLSRAVQSHSDEWFVFQPEWNRRDVANQD
ncbi:MAG: lysophospholipid acyltransferase family protein [Gemmatimonadaceae bacterium]|nr:lysophospholipid acyltransferase family protein [Gemmatimonadaceae bacterium]